MKSCVVVFGLACLAGMLLGLSPVMATGPDELVTTASVGLPETLENHYPPRAQGPGYLIAMHQLSRPFSGMIADLFEGDTAGVRANFEAFREAYTLTSGMIPEWQSRYPLAPIDRLGNALISGDHTGIMSAVDEVGAVCHSCHQAFMGAVQQKFQWPDFGAITVTDPLSGEDVGFAKLMLMIETNFTGIGNNLAQGQQENALRQFAGFSARFQAMAEACMTCHDTERLYYVSADVTAMISGLQAELTNPDIDMARATGLMQSIGQESCGKCHLVHIPAAYAQQGFTSH